MVSSTRRTQAALRCEECGAESAGNDSGWLVLHVSDVEGVDPPFDVTYCPRCAEREFEPGERARSAEA